MPRSTHPDSTVLLVLDGDLNQTPQPKFFFRPPTMQDEEIIGQAFDGRDKDAKTFTEEISAAVKLCLTGFQNMGTFTYGADEIETILCVSEAHELLMKLLASGRLDREEKKSSESPASSEAE